MHRFDFDGRYAYISPTMDGYVGNIVMILDLKDPARPQEVGRWWMPGQWTAGGETLLRVLKQAEAHQSPKAEAPQPWIASMQQRRSQRPALRAAASRRR